MSFGFFRIVIPNTRKARVRNLLFAVNGNTNETKD